MTARVITTIRRLRRPRHACIVVMTLAVIMLTTSHTPQRPDTHLAAGIQYWPPYVLLNNGHIHT